MLLHTNYCNVFETRDCASCHVVPSVVEQADEDEDADDDDNRQRAHDWQTLPWCACDKIMNGLVYAKEFLFGRHRS